MESNNNKIISKRIKIMTTAKRFREKIDRHNNEITEQDIKLLNKSIKFHEDLANDKDEIDIEYLIDRYNYFENLFHSFLVKYNIDQVLEESISNNSTFIEAPDWIGNKKCTVNPQNKYNKCFKYSIIVSFIIKKSKTIQKEFQKLSLLLTILIGEILIFHHKNKIIKHSK